MKKQNPPETLQSLLKYESKPGQVQRFLACVGKNFRWPSSIPEYLKRRAFIKIADIDFEFEDEVGFNIIFFYNAFDRGEFVGHENEWVTVNNQKVIKYGEEYNDDQLNYILEIMPNAIQLPVDRTRLPRSAPETILPYHVKRIPGKREWSTITMIAEGYGVPAEQIHVSMMFEVSISDDNN
ncbi:hypothetical protein Glove_241g67 [Diversispora epigaea]|uniref:Uncharacterized protein n=1 Tax=Diversispora epigaea TaxID=1348612 RepID=A0A397IA67_9GLOM|nr:hypothetical protein Glove_241g67 [Diversispora epigaea]